MKTRFSKLRAEVPDNISSGSHLRVLWTCDCGRQVSRMYRDVEKGRTIDCGRCGWLTAEELAVRKFNSLKMKNPVEIAPCSNKQIVWVCDCGKEVAAVMQAVFKGYTKSCGTCGRYGRTAAISAAVMENRIFGHLRMKTPETIIPGSHRKVIWLCDCGKEKAIDINTVMLGKSKSCGHCDDIPAAEMAVRKFGRLRMKNPVDTPPGSGRKTRWLCDCGAETSAMIAHVIAGHTKSCGSCGSVMHAKFSAATDVVSHMKPPITPEQLPDWAPIALETIDRKSVV
jgi:hypothetical protein